MTWNYDTEIATDFWKNLFSQLASFEAVDSRLPTGCIFRIPIEEAVLICRLMPPTSQLFSVHVLGTRGNEEVILPEPLGAISFQGIHAVTTLLSPLLGHSMQFLRERFSEFFATPWKYLVVIETARATSHRYKHDIEEAQKALVQQGIPLMQSMMMIIDLKWRNHATGGVGLNRAYIPEPVLTYVAASHFRERGFITDTFREQLLQAAGGPDLYAIRLPDIQRTLVEAGITNAGFYLFELETGIKEHNRPAGSVPLGGSQTIVLEVESGRKAVANGHGQLIGYLSHGQFNEGYMVAPFMDTSSYDDVGLFTCSPTGKIQVRPCPHDYGRAQEVSRVLREVERMVKLGLLKNIPLGKVLSLLPPCNSYADLHYGIDEVSLSEIIKWVTKEPRQ